MNKNIRNALVLLALSLGSTYGHFVSASSMQPPVHFRPAYYPVPVNSNLEHVIPRYRFRPVSEQAVNSLNRRPPAVRYFWGYPGTVMPLSGMYSPYQQPAQVLFPRFTGRNSWQSAEYNYPRTGYFHRNHFRNPAIHPQMWRGPSTSPITNYSFIQRVRQQSMPIARAGGQQRYFGRFRPLPAERLGASGVVASNWGWQPQAYQRPFPRPHLAPFFAAGARYAPVHLAYSSPMFNGWRKMADNRRYPPSGNRGFAPANNNLAISLQRPRFPSRASNQRGFLPPPRFAEFHRVPNSEFFTGYIRNYRFRPDDRMVNSQKASGAADSAFPFFDGMHVRPAPSTSSNSYRFRPDDRFSQSYPAGYRQLFPLIWRSSEAVESSRFAGASSEFTVTGLRPSSFETTDSEERVDLYEHSVLGPVRRKHIFGIKSIADYPTS